MSERHGILDTIFDTLAPVHSDGHKFVAIGAGLALLFFLLWPPLGWVCALVTAWIIYFFRDPARVTPLRDGLVLAAGDGRVSSIEKVRPPAELGMGPDERVRISTFLSVFELRNLVCVGNLRIILYNHQSSKKEPWVDRLHE